MNGYDVKRLALILALQAEIEGMKTENTTREQLKQSLAYVDSDFQYKAEELLKLAYAHDDQLIN